MHLEILLGRPTFPPNATNVMQRYITPGDYQSAMKYIVQETQSQFYSNRFGGSGTEDASEDERSSSRSLRRDD